LEETKDKLCLECEAGYELINYVTSLDYKQNYLCSEIHDNIQEPGSCPAQCASCFAGPKGIACKDCVSGKGKPLAFGT